MKKIYTFLSFAVLIIIVFRIAAFKLPDDDRAQIAAQMEHSIKTELLNKWYPQSVDKEYGGFLSTFSYDFKPTGSQDKMIVTQGRHVWSNAKAAELYPDVAWYKTSAAHGFHFLKDVMWDKTYGGFYTLVTRQGKVKPSMLGTKIAYGNSFGIYGLAAYYQCSGDTSALNFAKQAFLWLDKHSHDPVYKGYFQHLENDGTPVKRTSAVPSIAETGYKDQNTSIHLLESFTELYNVWPDSLLRERLQEMLLLVRDKITTNKGYLTLFFQPDWTPVSFRDSSKEVILKHSGLDHVSFGHDVETAYLMLEASHALGWEHDSTTLTIGKKMVDHALKNGWDNKVGGFYDEGYYFKDSAGITIIRDTKNWWAQAEGLNTLLLMADRFPDDPMQYFQKFKMLWNYVQTYLIDHEHGDWYPGGLDKEPGLKTALKGQIWKGTYHVFRSLSNCAQRLMPDTISPSSPEKLVLKPVSNTILLQWEKSRDNKTVLGYNIYKNSIRIGFTPLDSFSISGLKKMNKENFVVKALDLEGNLSRASNEVSYY